MVGSAQSAPAARAAGGKSVQVMVVDDSAVIRGQLVRALEASSDIDVVASVGNGEVALKTLDRYPIDVVVLDIEMPVMDGMTALPLLLKKQPKLKIIMASTLTLSNAKISLDALGKGAADYIAKPTSSGAMITADDFKLDLVSKVRALGGITTVVTDANAAPTNSGSLYKGPVKLRSPGPGAPSVLAIGSSTGGPQVLIKLFGELKSRIKVPVLVTQHMPANFTTILAEHIHRASGTPCAEAKDGEAIVPGHIYVAPGDYHMVVERKGADRIIRLNQGARENFCRPAVDPMLRSIAEAYGASALVAILTGMGHDGRDGAGNIVDAGGTVIAQDEASSVVWGMPGAVATAGLCSAVLNIDQIAPHIAKALGS